MEKSKYKNKQERLPENDKNNVAFYKKKNLDQEKTKDETETRETQSKNILSQRHRVQESPGPRLWKKMSEQAGMKKNKQKPLQSSQVSHRAAPAMTESWQRQHTSIANCLMASLVNRRLKQSAMQLV